MSKDVQLNKEEFNNSAKQDMQNLVARAKIKLDEFLGQLNHIVLDKPQQTKLAKLYFGRWTFAIAGFALYG